MMSKILIAILCVSLLPFANAEWTMFSNDLQNTNSSFEKGNFAGVEKLFDYEIRKYVLSSPLSADINDDGKNEIIFSDISKNVSCISNEGSLIWKKEIDATLSFLAIAELNGQKTIIITTQEKTIALNKNGNLLWTFDIEDKNFQTINELIISSPKIADINNDGKKEIIFGSANGNIYCLDENGTLIWNKTFYNENKRDAIISTVAISDIDGNDPEIVFQTYSGIIYALHSNGTEFWKVNTFTRSSSSPTIADINNDGKKEIIASFTYVSYVFNFNGSILWSYLATDKISSSQAVADLDNDGKMEIALANDDDGVILLNANGIKLWNYLPRATVSSTPTIADIDNNGENEIIFGSYDGNLYALNKNGKKLWSYEGPSIILNSPIISDLNNDSFAEIIFISGDILYVLTNTSAKTDLGIIEITFSKKEVVETEDIYITAIVENFGTVDTTNFTIDYYDNGNFIKSREIICTTKGCSKPKNTTTHVSVNGIEYIGITWKVEGSGEHKIKVVINLTDENLTNNIMEKTFNAVKREVDLTIDKDKIIQTEIKEDRTLNLHAVVFNNGNVGVENLIVYFYDNDNFIGELIFSFIDKNSSFDKSINFIATKGKHKIKIVVDAKNEINETNESNNIAEIEFEVGKEENEKGFISFIDFSFLIFAIGIVLIALYYKKNNIK